MFTPSNNGATPLHAAARSRDLDVVERLVELGANLDYLNQNLNSINNAVIKQFIDTHRVVSKYKDDYSLEERLNNEEILTLAKGLYAYYSKSSVLYDLMRQGKIDIKNYNVSSQEAKRTSIGESLIDTIIEQLTEIPEYNEKAIERKKDDGYSIEIQDKYLYIF